LRSGSSFLLHPGLLVGLLIGLVLPVAVADESSPAESRFFETEVRPLLVERCWTCHGDTKAPKGGLRLTSRASVLQGGDSGPAAVAAKPAESLLVQAVRYHDEPKMPPKEKLKDRQIEVLARWVAMGLPWPVASVATHAPALKKSGTGEFTDEPRRFWAFQPIKDVNAPEVRDKAWARSAVDRFILAALEEKGFRPAEPADKRTLIRRATFDLIGLPPSPDEVNAFLADRSPNAFAQVVDRLLASPHYGERWGRHWLDVVRYADARDLIQLPAESDFREAWRYRDWVVASFNRDLPYPEFLQCQIAGDLLPPTHPAGINADGLIATGMLAIADFVPGDVDKDQMIADYVNDQIDVVGRAFLGLSLACARCHDHKFDPISTEDYYALAGIFFSTRLIPGPVPGNTPLVRVPLLPRDEIAKLDAQDAADKKRLAEQERIGRLPAASQARLVALRRELDDLKTKRWRDVPRAVVVQDGGPAGTRHEGFKDAQVYLRGNPAKPGKTIPRGFPRILTGEHRAQITKESGRRQLADWLARPEHPLTARVMVNRIWQHHFGEGLVRTPNDFGKRGERPTHPELLDYLAVRFVESGWSVKTMHRLIMQSSAYQQFGLPTAGAAAGDPENRLVGRMSRRRLDAEAIRDSLLAVAGLLDAAFGGPAFLDQAVPRRTIYLLSARTGANTSDFGRLFDRADPGSIVDRRGQSIVAPQALFFMNDPFVGNAARALAARVASEAASSALSRIDRLYAIALGRPPTPSEIEIGLGLLTADSEVDPWARYCQIVLCSNEFIYLD
jgi:hypothetical protein